ncbi:MAG: heme lyase CcmF/NrfE family subunit [Gemmatimonadaceae bacterium]
MTGLLAHDALLIGAVTVCFGAVMVPVAMRSGRRHWIQLAYGAVYTNFMLVTIAVTLMVVALVTHDFSVSYVAAVGSRSTPLLFTIISLWGALEGSILFWAWVLAFYAAALVWMHRRRPGNLIPYAAMTMLLVSLFFAILLVGPADPFKPVFPVPADGPGPNTLLQNHILMAVHPPLLYLGYVGMTVPFALAVGAILSNEANINDWVVMSRRWMLASWGLLSAAIIAGRWWSYEVLGWGGYWAWDPVENASFLPWLTATAYLHSVMVQERRNMLRLWTLNLCVATFVLTILGTFLTRSGILSSVHAFTRGAIGYYFLGFIAVVLVAAIALVAGHSDRVRTKGTLGGAASRETVFLLNNMFLTAVMLTVLVGTLYPLIAEALRGVKVSVGEPFFNQMAVPAMVALIFLMGVGPALPWGNASWAQARQRLRAPIAGTVILAAIGIAAGARDPYAIAAFACVGYAATANLREYWVGARARRRAHGEHWGTALGRLTLGNRRRYGGYLAHVGILFVALGVAASSEFRSEREATLRRGETLTVAGQTVRLTNVWGKQEAQRFVVGASLDVIGRDSAVIGMLQPRMNFYPVSEQPVPTPDVRSRLSGDLYANLQAFDPRGTTATVKLIAEPLVPWIWFGGLVTVIGAVIGMFHAGKLRTRTA